MNRVLSNLDLKLFRYLLALPHYPLISRIARAVSKTGDGWLYVLIMPLSILLLKTDVAVNLILFALLGFALERGLYWVLKNGFKRQRPPDAIKNFNSLITPSDKFSMPSGHTSAAFFVATFLSFAVSLAFLPLYLWALCVGISRVLLGVHFPTDIVAGATLGTSIALFVL